MLAELFIMISTVTKRQKLFFLEQTVARIYHETVSQLALLSSLLFRIAIPVLPN
jgi:hypothetical protein